MIRWNFDPEIFSLAVGGLNLAPRWYSLSFIVGFLIGYQFLKKIYFKEGYTEEQASSLLVHCLLGTLIGARLGHCLFYDPAYYLANPLEIIKTWKGGLASHGGYLGVIVAVFLYLRNMPGMNFMWIIDRIAPPALLTGAFIRIGNLLNSEILGKPTDVPWAVIFEKVDQIPRHPTQVYESMGYFVISMILFALYKLFAHKWVSGRILGATFALGFSWRFFVEFFKENQEAFEQGMLINMGQALSIPFILFGLYLFTGKHAKAKWLRFFTQPLVNKPKPKESSQNKKELKGSKKAKNNS